jgi:hypothetical protein
LTGRSAIVTGLALLLACSAALLLASAADPAAVAVPTSQWQLLSGARMDIGQGVAEPFWAASRVWIPTADHNVPVLWSARPAGRRLTSLVRTRVPDTAIVRYPIVDERLVLGGHTGAEQPSTAPLLANGRLGDVKPVADDLLARAKEIAPRAENVGVDDGVRVGDRIVWSLVAWKTLGIGGGLEWRMVCCGASGAAVDLTRLTGHAVLFPRIGRDARGRLWLSWLDHRDYPHAVRGVPRILELDASTLAPRSKPLAIPGAGAVGLELVCAASCRLVAQSDAGDIVSWAPGERSATRVASHWERGKLGDSPMRLLAAAFRSGRLVVAYHGVRGKTRYDVMAPDTIHVVQGDARGARPRVLGSIAVANSWPPQNRTAIPTGPLVYGTFAPSGLVAVETFQFTRTPTSPSPVVAAVVPLGAG